MERSNPMITVSPKPKKVYHYNLTSSTQEDFDNLVQVNRSKKHLTQLDPLLRSLGQLTPTNVLTIKGYYDVKGVGVQNLRMKILKMAKGLNIVVETTFSKDKQALLVRIKRNWPVGVDINIGA
jgi:hypothetical protein|tara:strand:+ start:2443 stop:2811 length:369 start_codon:yes stop_codon:yes gene_type:complete